MPIEGGVRDGPSARVNGGRVGGVETATGPITADTVVLAAGAWANELLRPLDTYLPAVPQVTSRIITEPLDVPLNLPLLFLSWAPGHEYLWVRGEQGRLVWGGPYQGFPRQIFEDQSVDGRFDEIPIDGVLHCQRLAAKAAVYMPILNRFKTISVKHGAPCHTPDHRALIGPVPGLDGLYAIAGDCESGITHGPGFGKILADSVVRGESQLADARAWRIDRFDETYRTDAEVAEAIAVALAAARRNRLRAEY